MNWDRVFRPRAEGPSAPPPPKPETPPAPTPTATAPTPVPSSAAGTFGTPFFGCADIHTPHFGVTHTALDAGE